MIRVVLADDQALLRAGFRMLLEAAGDIEVCGEAANGGTAVALTRRERPDVVLMDLRMPDVDGVTATSLITGDPALADVRVVVLTTFGDDQNVFAALRAGASGFLVKDTEPDALLRTVREVVRGGVALDRGDVQRDRGPSPREMLTRREREVVSLVAAGMSNDEIATELTVSPLTAKTHVSRAMTKLGARDRAQLVVLAYQHGLAARPR